MSYGSTAKILRVNLSTGAIGLEELTEDFYRLYPVGKALAGYSLLHEIPAYPEPFAPENMLVMANSLLTGSPETTATRYGGLGAVASDGWLQPGSHPPG